MVCSLLIPFFHPIIGINIHYAHYSFTGFKETCIFLLVTLAIAQGLPVNNRQTPCIQVDQSSRDLIVEMLFLLKKLSANVTSNIRKIVSNFKRLA